MFQFGFSEVSEATCFSHNAIGRLFFGECFGIDETNKALSFIVPCLDGNPYSVSYPKHVFLSLPAILLAVELGKRETPAAPLVLTAPDIDFSPFGDYRDWILVFLIGPVYLDHIKNLYLCGPFPFARWLIGEKAATAGAMGRALPPAWVLVVVGLVELYAVQDTHETDSRSTRTNSSFHTVRGIGYSFVEKK